MDELRRSLEIIEGGSDGQCRELGGNSRRVGKAERRYARARTNEE